MSFYRFDNATVAGSAPTRDSFEAALPESERGLAAPYLDLFAHGARYAHSADYVGYWVQAYLTRRDDLLTVARNARHVGDAASRYQTRMLASGLTYPSPANILTGMTHEDETRITGLFDSRCTFGAGLSFLTEGDRIDRVHSAFAHLNVSVHIVGVALDIFVDPQAWRDAGGDVDVLLLRSVFCPTQPELARRFMEAARRLAPGAGVIDAAPLFRRFSLNHLEQLAADGIPLEYALA